MGTIVEFGRIAAPHFLRALDLLTTGSQNAIITVPLPLNVLHLPDDIIKQLLGLDLGDFYAIKYRLEQPDTTAGALLVKAASHAAESISPTEGVIIYARDLRCDYDAVSEYFMDRELRHMVTIARHRTAALLRQLAVLNPGLQIAVIDDEGGVMLMSVEDALQIPAQQLLPAI